MTTSGMTCLLALVMAQADDTTVRRLTLHPSAAPVPALRYLLLPELETQTPGNAALFYDRAMVLLSEHRPASDFGEQVDKWLEIPLDQLPVAEVRKIVPAGSNILRELSLAAHCRRCDWQLDFRTEGIHLLLPEIQRMRQLGKIVALRIRVLIADGRLEEALPWVETGFSMARHAGDGPTLIQSLVGIALANLMCDRVEELIQRPGAPNLYWALTTLPRPFIALRAALEGEKTLFLKDLVPSLAELEAMPLTAEQARKRFEKLLNVVGEVEGGPRWQLDAAAVFLTAKFYPTAKQYLVQHGVPAERAEAMAPLQVVLIFSLHQYTRARDDLFKWMSLPYWQAAPGLQQADDQLRRMRSEMQEGFPIASTLLPAVGRVAFAQARAERRLAILRTVEGLRLYSADHEGQLPATLQALAPLPLLIDAVTGKPFEYHVEGERATLSAPPPPGKRLAQHESLRYELLMRR